MDKTGMRLPDFIQPDRPVLIAGPTASGKSALALAIAEAQGGVIINADALQVFDAFRLLTARPDPAEESRAQHRLYGHVSYETPYSVGDWLRDLAPHLQGGPRPIIVGGTGLYFGALTAGLADIPVPGPEIRARADRMSREAMIGDLDAQTRARIDLLNRARVQRAWEVLAATGRGLASWQDETPSPLLALEQVTAIHVQAPKDWLDPRIARRFDQMMARGALAEVEALLPRWNPALPASKAIGAPELIAHLRGQLSLADAREAAIIATTQYAKRQRTWFRGRMRKWHDILGSDLAA